MFGQLKVIFTLILCPHALKRCLLLQESSAVYCKQGPLAVRTAQILFPVMENEETAKCKNFSKFLKVIKNANKLQIVYKKCGFHLHSQLHELLHLLWSLILSVLSVENIYPNKPNKQKKQYHESWSPMFMSIWVYIYILIFLLGYK